MLRIASIWLVGTVLCGSAHAIPISTNFGGTLGSLPLLVLRGESSVAGGGADLAVRFTVPLGGPDFALTSIELPLAESGATVDRPLHIHLMTDAGGTPGSSLETITITGIPSGSPSQALPFMITSLTRPALLAGATYWIAADATASFFGSWDMNRLGQTGFGAFRVELADGGETAWLPFPDDIFDPTYRVSGDPLAAVPVQEPATLALLMIGLLAMLTAQPRRSVRMDR